MNITRLLAPNPGPFTGTGTNTYVIESAGEALIIDPGPVDDSHFDVIRDALVELDPVGVAVTHTHSDHAPAANPLAVELEVPAYGFAPGPGFEPDVRVSDGQEIGFGTEAAVGLHTPGHSADHLCYRARDVLFTGDHIMGGSTVVVEDMVSYLSSLRRLQGLGLKALFPGHGPKIDDPERVIAEYLEHRMQRERQVLEAVGSGAKTLGDVVARVYADVDASLHPLAAVSVGAHLRKLHAEGRVALVDGAAEWGSPVSLPEEATE